MLTTRKGSDLTEIATKTDMTLHVRSDGRVFLCHTFQVRSGAGWAFAHALHYPDGQVDRLTDDEWHALDQTPATMSRDAVQWVQQAEAGRMTYADAADAIQEQMASEGDLCPSCHDHLDDGHLCDVCRMPF